ncbi:MAG: sodium:solute symporter family protein [Candidatus Aenigmarchaeota archaeon]|nr:sodium:solute symporter family protein [Candidatus Aenigmarchaeota archaeon]
MALSTLDLTIIIAYIFVILLVGFYVGRREKLEDFLVNRRKTKLLLLVTSLVSSTAGAGFIFGTASGAYQSGISIGITIALAYVPGLLAVSYLAPKINAFGRKYDAHTIGDFFGMRYSKRVRVITALLTLVAFFVFLALQFVAIAGLITIITGLDFTIGLFASALATIAYVSVSGIKSDFYTDFVQFWLMIIFLFLLLVPLGLLSIGTNSFASLPASYFDPFAFGGVEFFIGGLILGIPLILVSMDMWQRIYAAESEKTAKRVFQLGALVLIPFALIPTVLGMIGAVALPSADPDTIVFALMTTFLPTGLLGIGLAGILAVIMSTLDSMLMVGTATLTKDFYKTLAKKNARDEDMLKMARIFTVIFGLLGLATAFLYPDILQLVLTGSFILVILIPALLGGFFWQRANSTAAFWSTLIGFVVLLMALPSQPRTAFIPSVIAAVIVFVVLSYTTKHSESERIKIW